MFFSFFIGISLFSRGERKLSFNFLSGILGVLTGVLESEGFANNGYPPNFNKTYEIEVSEGKCVTIEFTNLDQG